MPSKAEFTKKELLLDINLFNKPAELIGKDAWAKLAINLLFLRKGTYPSVPEMGIGIQDYEYEFVDTAILKLNEDIMEQFRTYLPDLPLVDVQVSSTKYNGHSILIVGLIFNNGGNIETTAVAATISNKLIDFEISW